jgi:hypothetical protein
MAKGLIESSMNDHNDNNLIPSISTKKQKKNHLQNPTQLPYTCIDLIKPDRILIGNHGEILDMIRIPHSFGKHSVDERDKKGEGFDDLAIISNSPQLRIMDSNMKCQVLEGHIDIILAIDISDDG